MPDTKKGKPDIDWFKSFTISHGSGGLPIVEIHLPHAKSEKKNFKFMVVGQDRGFATASDLYTLLASAFESLKELTDKGKS